MFWRQAKTVEDAEVVRLLRNAGREWFHSSDLITPEQQHAWWMTMSALPAWDFWCILVGLPIVGYGMLTRRDGRLWVSLCVDPKVRGHGYGTEIYRLIRRSASVAPVYAAIRSDNLPSLRAARTAGYVDSKVPAPGPTTAADWIVLEGT